MHTEIKLLVVVFREVSFDEVSHPVQTDLRFATLTRHSEEIQYDIFIINLVCTEFHTGNLDSKIEPYLFSYKTGFSSQNCTLIDLVLS